MIRKQKKLIVRIMLDISYGRVDCRYKEDAVYFAMLRAYFFITQGQEYASFIVFAVSSCI